MDKQTILDLLTRGVQYANLAETEVNVHSSENLARRALGYLEAAQALLYRFAEFHNDLIDHPAFVQMRAFQRRFPL